MAADLKADDVRRLWVETWQRAEVELEAIRRAEVRALDTRKAVRRIFRGLQLPRRSASPTSGLVEQQAWFARLREIKRES
jgi:hypothetical protein